MPRRQCLDVFGRTNDHKILDAALCLQAKEPGSKVILVSKDINLRLKAKALVLPAEVTRQARSRTTGTCSEPHHP